MFPPGLLLLSASQRDPDVALASAVDVNSLCTLQDPAFMSVVCWHQVCSGVCGCRLMHALGPQPAHMVVVLACTLGVCLMRSQRRALWSTSTSGARWWTAISQVQCSASHNRPRARTDSLVKRQCMIVSKTLSCACIDSSRATSVNARSCGPTPPACVSTMMLWRQTSSVLYERHQRCSHVQARREPSV